MGGDSDGCFKYGYNYEWGRGVEKDYIKANEFYSIACEERSGEACHSLGFSYRRGLGVRQDNSKAKGHFGKSCDLGYQRGCDRYRELNEAEVLNCT
jgi:uncharacterized protein